MVKSTFLFLVLAFAAVAINGAPLDRRRQKNEQSQDESKLSPCSRSRWSISPFLVGLIFGGKDPASQLAPAGKDPNRSKFGQNGLFDNQAQLDSGPGVGPGQDTTSQRGPPNPNDRTEKKE